MSEDTTQLSDALAANYMLVDLTIRSWSGRKTDQDATSELLTQKGATRDGGAFVKKLLASADAELKAVHTAAGSASTYVRKQTLPWSPTKGAHGLRLLATVRSMQFLGGLQPYVQDHRNAVRALADVWDARVNTALANLGQLANRGDYPMAAEVPGLFHIGVDLLPIPKVTDYTRVNIPAEFALKLGERHAQMTELAVQNAMDNLRERILEGLERIQLVLGKQGSGERTRIFDSLLGNMEGLVALGKSMDMGRNERFTALISRIESDLLRTPVSAYKVSPDKAREAAAVAQGLAVEAAIEEIWQ